MRGGVPSHRRFQRRLQRRAPGRGDLWLAIHVYSRRRSLCNLRFRGFCHFWNFPILFSMSFAQMEAARKAEVEKFMVLHDRILAASQALLQKIDVRNDTKEMNKEREAELARMEDDHSHLARKLKLLNQEAEDVREKQEATATLLREVQNVTNFLKGSC
ncbi:hypothetical protein QR680_012923 [Steinernema hermaphroditum]|uniref:Uncharacterized protein n=1 Tax=Steinernema hermaphroditum TaxID=289476 RepID=A0AA39M1M4_9BILA|nr:hypothetical protein QR680_012923 [Steinernema hermaphroditum]